MEFSLLVNGARKILAIEPLPDGGHKARVDGREFRLSWTPIGDDEWCLHVDGRPIRACLAARGEETWISIGGRTYRLEEAGAGDSRPRRRGGPEDRSGQMTPPMPAAVIRVLVAEGDRVSRGQPLVVLSAMKMETTLTAPYRGAVKSIRVTVGAQVMPGDTLLEIEPAGEEDDGR